MEVLMHYMDKHPENGKKITCQEPHKASSLSTSCGQIWQSVPAWRKVWIDLKYRAKKKFSQNLISLKKQGVYIYIRAGKKKAIQMASLRSAVTGSSSNCYGAAEVHRELTIGSHLQLGPSSQGIYVDREPLLEFNVSSTS